MNIQLNSDIVVNGTKTEKSKLYLVTFIDQEDPEDTTTEFWMADSDDELEEQLKFQWSGCDTDEEFEEWNVDCGWEFDHANILISEIGTV